VDHGPSDITALMRKAIAEPVLAKWQADSDIGTRARGLLGQDSTGANLVEALRTRSPALVVTTSHGMTGPLSDPALMARQLGLPVDRDQRLVTPPMLLAEWQPDGAIWYAHACCSAGAASGTRFAGLVAEDSPVDRILGAVGALGAQVSPLPRALLGAEKPLRAFIGHGEPTFDWTIRDPQTRQRLTSGIQNALCTGMFQLPPETVTMAFDRVYRDVGTLLAQWAQAKRDIAGAMNPAELERARGDALRTRLMALDRQSMVILGDPTACIPPLRA
jgi:hypothetical protein